MTGTSSTSSNIKVAVRCRPLNARELARGAKGLVRMQGNQTILEPPEGRSADRGTKTFAFDYSYWSAGSKDHPDYASQQTLYEDLGKELLDHAFEAFNCCIFAYGQTGSGKSYSMMGYGEDKGIIPLICQALFDRIAEKTTDNLTFNVEVSYIEIYQEKVRDLLNPANKGNLRVREHPSLGPYVEGLSKLAVNTFADMDALMDEGMKARSVASTLMNETSSRSHAVFTIVLTQRRHDKETNMVGEKISRISLVDLAGSERANSTGATGQRLKEGALINKSLTTLGRVISTLAAASSTPSKHGRAAADKVPYRDSVLTWLLKESLGGNSKTAMIATISPADYEETLSTLRYADQAKKIKNKAVVNEDPNAKLIRELKEELAVLRSRMTSATDESTYDLAIPAEQQIVSYRTKDGEIKQITKAQLQDQLDASEKLMASLSETWEEKLLKTRQIQEQREKVLESLGISIDKNEIGVSAPRRTPHLVNLNEDPLMSECLVYQIKPGRTTVGHVDAVASADIRLSGSSILPEHCHFENSDKGIVTLHAVAGGITMVNGQRLAPETPRELRSGYRIILGDFHVFRFNNPDEVRRLRDQAGANGDLRTQVLSGFDSPRRIDSSTSSRSDSPAPPEHVDWSFARREAVTARLNGSEVNLDTLDDDELNRLFKSVVKVKHSRNGSTSIASGSRPESRLSLMETLTETSIDDEDSSAGGPSGRPSGAWSTNATSRADSKMTVSADDAEERIEAVKTEYEERMQAMLQSSVVEVDEIRAQKEQMEAKVRALEAQVEKAKVDEERKSRALAVPMTRTGSSTSSRSAIIDWRQLSPEEVILARKVVKQWRKQRTLKIAEDILSKAVLVKEANVLARDMRRDVTFQLTVADRRQCVMSRSIIQGLDTGHDAWQSHELEDLPSAGIRVLDSRHRVANVWSMATFEARLTQMRNLLKFVDRPGYCEHLSLQDPFRASGSTEDCASLVATGLFSLAGTLGGLSMVTDVHLVSPYMTDPIGTIRLRVTAANVKASDKTIASDFPGAPDSQLTFTLEFDRLRGLTDAAFSELHLEVRRSSMFGVPQGSDQDDVYASSVVAVYGTTCANATLRCEITCDLNGDVLEHLRSQPASVDVFARPKAAHLDTIEQWDVARDAAVNARSADVLPLRGDPSSTNVARRNESEFVAEQRHDVIAKIGIQELGSDGEFAPVPVTRRNVLDRGAFAIRQGVQRRLAITLAHNSGRGWRWRKISKATVSNVRLQDSNGFVNSPVASSRVQLRAVAKSRAGFASDGTAVLSFEGSWDSAAHDCLLLNRVTASGQRIVLELEFEVQADNLDAPVLFSVDLFLTVQKRDASKPSRLFGLLRTDRVFPYAAALFAIRLRPKVTRNAADIWRLDTSDTYVRGEEQLEAWRPRGLSLLRDFVASQRARRRAADVEVAKTLIELTRLTLPQAAPGSDNERLLDALSAWQAQTRSTHSIDFERAKSSVTLSDLSSEAAIKKRPPLSLIGTASLVQQTDLAAKKGYMAVLRDPTRDAWRKYWAVLQRLYLHLYESNAEYDEVMVINLSSVRVEQSPEIEAMLERQYSFAIFTQQNSYFIQAPAKQEMVSWIKAIDPSLA